MRRALAILSGLLVLSVLAGCGEKEEPEITGPPVVVNQPEPEPGPGDSGPEVGDGLGGVGLEKVGEFDSPVFLVHPDGERSLYVVEQTGRIVRVAPNGRRSTFLDISRQVKAGGEQGLLSAAFAPDFSKSRLLYVDYTNRAGDTRVVQYRANPKARQARPKSARTVLAVDQPYPNHNGGLLLFGPDGNLLIGLGDGGAAGDPQRNGLDRSTLLGSILRIDPSKRSKGEPYSIPQSNPFRTMEGARPEILAYGLRNPWRFSFDRGTGGLWIGDVGQNSLEEIDYLGRLGAGASFGWSAYEGTERFNSDQDAPNALEPILTYGRDEGCSVTGGYVVRDRALESLYGRYLYADFCQGQLRSFPAEASIPGPAVDDQALGIQVPSISSFAEDRKGRIYAISLDGPVHRLVPERG